MNFNYYPGILGLISKTVAAVSSEQKDNETVSIDLGILRLSVFDVVSPSWQR